MTVEHKEQMIVAHVNYANVGREQDDDVMVVCAHCLAEDAGILAAAGADDLAGAYWDPERYPYDASAPAGSECWRPGPDWPPSLREVETRRELARSG